MKNSDRRHVNQPAKLGGNLVLLQLLESVTFSHEFLDVAQVLLDKEVEDILRNSFKKIADFILFAHRGFCNGAKVQYVLDIHYRLHSVAELARMVSVALALFFLSSLLPKMASSSAMKLF